MRYAKSDEPREMLGLFRAVAVVFLHMRQDALLCRIAAGQCVYEAALFSSSTGSARGWRC